VGTAVFDFDGQACRLDYSVVCDRAWHTRSTTVTGWVGDTDVAVTIAVDADKRWTLNGVECDEVAGCVDVDLNFSPSTNLLPIRRLRLEVGQARDVRAAWLRFPTFRLEPLVQRYECLEKERYRFESGGGEFVAELTVNDIGLITSYGDLWRVEEPHGTFEHAQPILCVANMARSLRYYVDVLGFSNAEWGSGDFTLVTRDGAHIYLSEGDQGQPGTWVWLGVEDVAALYEEYKAKGAEILHAPENQAWALEMKVADPDGHVLRFGSDPKKEGSA
jgi:catechol 2,3-dioxygenase-like lactoylglutathione lyase family enzyme